MLHGMHQNHICAGRTPAQRGRAATRHYYRDSNCRRIAYQPHPRYHKLATSQGRLEPSNHSQWNTISHAHSRATTRQHNYSTARHTHYRHHSLSTTTCRKSRRNNAHMHIPPHLQHIIIHYYNNSNNNNTPWQKIGKYTN